MPDAANELLSQIKEEQASKKATNLTDAKGYYSRLLIYKHKRRAMWAFLGVFFVIFMWMLYHYIPSGRHWMSVAIPITILGIVVALYPPTEEWDYNPWQTRAQRYERHFID